MPHPNTNLPKHAGERAYGHGDQITFELDTVDDAYLDDDGKLPRGYFVDLNGDGTVSRGADYETSGAYDGVTKHSRAPGEDVTVHLRGSPRVAEGGHEYDVVDTVDGEDVIVLR